LERERARNDPCHGTAVSCHAVDLKGNSPRPGTGADLVVVGQNLMLLTYGFVKEICRSRGGTGFPDTPSQEFGQTRMSGLALRRCLHE
jgi:hypothetical protein